MTQPIQTSAYWEETASGYVANAEPFTALFCEDAVQLAEIEPGMTLLDIATGPGALALAAARSGARVIAIDFSQGMIDRLSSRSSGAAIDVRLMDGQALDLPSGAFDRVCSVFGIPLFPNWRAGLSEMVRVLKPGGRAVLGLAANPYGFGPNHLFAEARRAILPDQEIDIGLPGMTALCDAGRLVTELERAGLDSVVLHSRSHDIVLPTDVLTSDHPMIASNPLVIGLSDAELKAVVAEAKIIAEQWRRGSAIQMPGTAHIAVATKH